MKLRWRWALFAGLLAALAAIAVGLTPAAAPTQPQARLGPGIHERHLTWNAVNRRYLVFVPKTIGTVPAPVVVNFHGGRSRAENQVALSQMNRDADRAGFVVIYPEGIGLGRWHNFNAGTCCGLAQRRRTDDIGFTMAVLADVEGMVHVNASRVYATGMSNGGMMAYRLACERADRVAAIAPVAGGLVFQPCRPARAVPLLHFHGTADRIVPFEGGTAGKYPSVDATIAEWRRHNGCTDESRVTYTRGEVECRTYTACRDGGDVTLCRVSGGGHTWPGGAPFPIGGHTSRDIDASAYMLQFFTEHPIQEQRPK